MRTYVSFIRNAIIVATTLLATYSPVLAQIATPDGDGGNAIGGQVTPAATLVAALLEHQGLLAQARILDSFTGFFRDAGALIYLIAGIGAVASVVLYGSFRAPRYLLIGPALFWFLVGPRVEIDGVVWKLGGGVERGVRGEENASRESRQRILEKLNQDGSLRPNVAQGFWLFAEPINEFTNEMVDLFLHNEDRDDLLVASKVYGLELIATMQPNDHDYILRAEQGFMLHCQQTVAEATAAAGALVKHRVGPNAENPSEQLNELVNHHTSRMLELANSHQEYVPTSSTGFGRLIKAHATREGGSELAKKLLKENGEPVNSINCADAWHLVAEESWHLAAKGMARVLRISTGALNNPQAIQTACEELTKKAVDDEEPGSDNAECNIQPAITLALLSNHIGRADTYNRLFARHWSNQEHTNPTKHVQLTAGGAEMRPIMKSGKYMMRWSTDGLNRQVPEIRVEKIEKTDDGKTKRSVMWAPVMELNQDYGLNDAMWVSTREYELVNLRQRIFSYAIHLPYFQGMLLYLIAVTYPFFALLVILPGKAVAFLNIPLAWLWVKSWDIGFAAIIVLDRVMYNMLPSAQLNGALHEGPWTDISLLPLVLSEGFNFDPLGSVHNYYSIISFVWFAVPVITGFVTLRAKRGVVSMFPEAAENLARESGSAASQGYSLTAQDKRNTMLREMQGFAIKLPTMGSNGVEGGAPGKIGSIVATGRAMASMAGQANPEGVLKGNISELAKLAGGGEETFLKTKKDIAISESNLQSQLLRSFDPGIGRWSDLGLLYGAYTAAMDGGGGYELYDQDANFTGAMISAYTNRLGVAIDGASDMSDGFARRMSTFYKQPVSTGAMAYMMNAFFSAGLGQDATTARQLRLAVGAHGYSDEAFSMLLFNSHPSTLGSSGVNGRFAQQEFSASLLGTMSPSELPGGSSPMISTLLSTVGSDREVTFSDGAPGGGVMGSAHSAFSTAGEYLNYDPNGSGYVPGTPVSHFQQTLSADSAFQNSDPSAYSAAVQHKTDVLVKYFGEEKIREYVTASGRDWGGSPTHSDLFAYGRYVDTQENNPAAFGIDTRFSSYIDSNPLATLDDLTQWAKSRGNREVGHNTGIRSLPGQVVTQGFELWRDPNDEGY